MPSVLGEAITLCASSRALLRALVYRFSAETNLGGAPVPRSREPCSHPVQPLSILVHSLFAAIRLRPSGVAANAALASAVSVTVWVPPAVRASIWS